MRRIKTHYMKLLTIDIEDRMKILGFYQIAGGFYGLYGIIRPFVQEASLGGLMILFYALGFGLFGFSLYCGNLLRKGKLNGLKLSLWNQLLQVVQFSISAISFGYYSGIRLSIGFDWTNLFLPDWAFGLSGFEIRYALSETANLFFIINLVPLIIIYLLNNLEEKIEQRKRIME